MKTLLLVLTCLGILFVPAFSQKSNLLEKNTLKGLKGVYVLVEAFNEEGLSIHHEQLLGDAKLRLSRAGIPVADEQASFKDKNVGVLYIRLSLKEISEQKGLYCFSLSIELQQEVRLARDSSITGYGVETYAVPASFGYAGKDNLRDIRNFANDSVDVFISDFLSVNSKR